MNRLIGPQSPLFFSPACSAVCSCWLLISSAGTPPPSSSSLPFPALALSLSLSISLKLHLRRGTGNSGSVGAGAGKRERGVRVPLFFFEGDLRVASYFAGKRGRGKRRSAERAGFLSSLPSEDDRLCPCSQELERALAWDKATSCFSPELLENRPSSCPLGLDYRQVATPEGKQRVKRRRISWQTSGGRE